MCKCKICGEETAKNRQTCKGCDALKKVAKKRENTPKEVFNIANKHLEKKPGLINVSWASFFKKNTKAIV
jgi:hypothetical protein